MQSKVLILDFGSQVTKLIARNIRELNVYCEIIPYNSSLEKIKSMNPDCLILSGSPASIYDKKPPLFDERILDDKFAFVNLGNAPPILVAYRYKVSNALQLLNL